MPRAFFGLVGSFVTIGGTAGVDPAMGSLAGTAIESQTRQILEIGVRELPKPGVLLTMNLTAVTTE
jgi:enamine deaminase RidA (YjgF/YER057c/UK114 family)